MRPQRRKRFGQHYLEAAWADKLVDAIDPRGTDTFLEVGPGPGALTLRLAPRVARLVAVEVDRDLAAALAPQLPGNVEIVEADILTFDLAAFPAGGPLRVAGNLPYNISSPIIFRLLDAARARRSSAPGQPLVDATLMLQREVADRLTAAPGTADYGVLSISVQLEADVARVLALPPGAFRPPPRVHSAVVRLTFRPPRVALRDPEVFERMVRGVFTQRRKTLANALAPFAAERGADARQALETAGIDSRRRAETLDLPELARLADVLSNR